MYHHTCKTLHIIPSLVQANLHFIDFSISHFFPAIFEDEGLKQKIAQQEEIILKRENSLADLREKIGDKDKSIQQLEDELEELKKKLKDEKEKSFDSVKEERDEKNALKLVRIIFCCVSSYLCNDVVGRIVFLLVYFRV